MNKQVYLFLTLLFILVLSACSRGSYEEVSPDETGYIETDSKVVTKDEEQEQTYPLVINSVYLATEEIIDDEVTLLIEATNISDEEIMVEASNFQFETKDKDMEFTRVQRGENEVTLKPNETNTFFNFQSVPDSFDVDTFDINDYQITYTGMHYNNHKAMAINLVIPNKYQEKVDRRISDFKAQIAELENERQEEENPIRITAYDANKNGAIYIRVENLTDKDFYFDANYVTIFDHGYEYQIDRKVHDSAFDPTVTIPPHGKFDYKQFYLLSNPYSSDKEEIVANMYGVHYHTGYPMAKEYDIYGNYEEELPEDFSID